METFDIYEATVVSLTNEKNLRHRPQLTSLPSSMANLKNLREVDASKNQISSFPVGLTNLKNLNIVDLSSNKVNEAFLLVSITDELS